MSNIKAVKKTVYQCTVCATEYDDRAEAEEHCGSYELEQPAFAIGTKVKVWYANAYRRARVIGILGPLIGNSCKGGKRRFAKDAHVYKYLLAPCVKVRGVTMKDVDFWESNLLKE